MPVTYGYKVHIITLAVNFLYFNCNIKYNCHGAI